MTDTLTQLFKGFTFTGDLANDAPAFLRFHGREGIARHVAMVAANAGQIAARTGADEQAALTAAWLHDISRALPYADMVEPARFHGVDLLPEELQAPQLIHGKLSAVIAHKIFGVTDSAILDAIRCHTTLRPNPSLMDKVLFIADKASWAPHEFPQAAGLAAALDESLNRACAYFLDWSWQQRYPVIHPWLRDAYEQFCLRKQYAESGDHPNG